MAIDVHARPDEPARHQAGGAPGAQQLADEAPDSTGHRAPLRGWARRAAIAGVVVAVIVGIVLRFWTRSGLWLDEALTVDIARLPLRSLHAALRQDGAPPLYYVLLHFWIKVFGSSNLAARSLSGVIGVLTLPVAWFAGRRFGGPTVAAITLVLVASAPFAVYYSTEARMYSLVILLTGCGYLALAGALRQPRPGNLLAVALVTAALLYTQYWSVYLVAIVAIVLAWALWRAEPGERRRRVLSALGAVVVGAIAFLPWVPTFFFQSQHTGTPWAPPPNFAAVLNAVTGFTDNQATLSAAGSNQGRLLALLYLLLAFLALFGAARDRWHIELDIRTRPPARAMSLVVVLTLVVAVAGGILDQSAFSPRYASVVFLPLLLVVAMGALTLLDAKVRTVVIAVAVIAGLALSVENIWTQRTQATQVASVLHAQARPGDVVAYCPDQLGPSVYRLTQGAGYRQITFPRGASPDLVDWIDYKAVAQAANPAAFARRLEAEAGTSHRIWLVWYPEYLGFGTKCQTLAADLLGAPGYGGHQWVNPSTSRYYEPMELTEFAPPRVPVDVGATSTPAG
jgi:mannosyltransferase